MLSSVKLPKVVMMMGSTEEKISEITQAAEGAPEAGAYTRPLFQLNVSTFRGVGWVHGFPPVCWTGGHAEV